MRTLTISRTQISSSDGGFLAPPRAPDDGTRFSEGGLTGHRKLTLRLSLPERLLLEPSSASTVLWSLLREHAPPMAAAAPDHFLAGYHSPPPFVMSPSAHTRVPEPPQLATIQAIADHFNLKNIGRRASQGRPFPDLRKTSSYRMKETRIPTSGLP